MDKEDSKSPRARHMTKCADTEHERFLQAAAATSFPESPAQVDFEEHHRLHVQRAYDLMPDEEHNLPVREQQAANEQLLDAAREGNLSRLLNAFEKRASVNARDRQGNTALHLAARKGRLDIILTLLEAGADVNAPNWANQTPLHVVRSIPAAKTLLAAGADPYLPDRFGQTLVTTRYTFMPEYNRTVKRTPKLTNYLARILECQEPIPTIEGLNRQLLPKGIQYHPHLREKALAKLAEQERDVYPFRNPCWSLHGAQHEGRLDETSPSLLKG